MATIRPTAIPEAAAAGVYPVACHDETWEVNVTDVVSVVALTNSAGDRYQLFSIRLHPDSTKAVFYRKGANDQVTVAITDKNHDERLDSNRVQVDDLARVRSAGGSGVATHIALVCEATNTAKVLITGYS